MSINSHLAPEDDPRIVTRATGPRREAPAVCYTCGADVPETPRFGNEATCDECQRAGRSVLKPWLVDVELPR